MSRDQEVRLRIRINDPPHDVRFQVQRGRSELLPAVRSSETRIEFEFPVRVATRGDGDPNFLGPFAQGPPHARFVYVNSGTLAGDAESCWTRRAKVPLAGIAWPAIRQACASGGVLESEIAGSARDGGPACGTVPLHRPWHAVVGESAPEAAAPDCSKGARASPRPKGRRITGR